ncbi:MAG: TniQ family protein [Gomphosphaeria aponina SAG 52.96 = DSM 107014]|uniref:TniQ family protein n=1 Tax=Gomphosphaeria aponina SAG 52.96 = DSM 107014 TaxID=1521640 RepID=A0A941GRC5_9CHRO|nr:TniQ family protein [Gomphosphaeria aponina SAG 52.96 = DSM 107014]
MCYFKILLTPGCFLEGESLSHFLGRVRRRNHLSAHALGDLVGIGSAIARWEKFYYNPFPSDAELTALGDLLGLDLAQLKAMLPSKGQKMKCQPIRLCGACYSESPYHRLEWQFQSVWKCVGGASRRRSHQLKLLSKCPQCGAKFKIPSLWEFGKCVGESPP